MTIAERIKARRDELGLSQTDLAKRVGVKDKSAISKMESSGNSVSVRTVERYAKALSTTPAALMGIISENVLFIDDEQIPIETHAIKAPATHAEAYSIGFQPDKYKELPKEYQEKVDDYLLYIYDRWSQEKVDRAVSDELKKKDGEVG